jgi:putative heme-binding domain-containing protein
MTPADLERGEQIYLASCASCHGQEGDQITGVDLGSGRFRRASTDQALAAIVRAGIPDTAMPPNTLSEADAARVVAYLRSLPAARLAEGPTLAFGGDADNGRAVYDGKGKCADCHRVEGSGGFLGPDLSSVGLTRRAGELERALIDPDVDMRDGSRVAVVVNDDGTTVTARLLNHDTYSLQLIETSGRLVSISKDDVRSWDIPARSVMPNYRGTLTDSELSDVLAYLRTLQVPVPANQPGGGRGRGGPAAAAAGGGRGGPR